MLICSGLFFVGITSSSSVIVLVGLLYYMLTRLVSSWMLTVGFVLVFSTTRCYLIVYLSVLVSRSFFDLEKWLVGLLLVVIQLGIELGLENLVSILKVDPLITWP